MQRRTLELCWRVFLFITEWKQLNLWNQNYRTNESLIKNTYRKQLLRHNKLRSGLLWSLEVQFIKGDFKLGSHATPWTVPRDRLDWKETIGAGHRTDWRSWQGNLPIWTHWIQFTHFFTEKKLSHNSLLYGTVDTLHSSSETDEYRRVCDVRSRKFFSKPNSLRTQPMALPPVHVTLSSSSSVRIVL